MSDTQSRQTVAAMIKRPLLAGVLAIGTAAMVAAPAPALADSFLKLTNIRGESTEARHKDEIIILSFTQSFINSGAGRIQCGPITVMKNIDRSSPLLLKAVAFGDRIPEGMLTFRAEAARNRGGVVAVTEYYTINMTEVIVSELTQTDNPDPSRIVEKLVLNAARFDFAYMPQDRNGNALPPAVQFSVDCRGDVER